MYIYDNLPVLFLNEKRFRQTLHRKSKHSFMLNKISENSATYKVVKYGRTG